MSLLALYRGADRRIRTWRRSRPWLWGSVFGSVVATCVWLVLIAVGTSPVEALLRASLFAVLYTGLTAWVRGPSAD